MFKLAKVSLSGLLLLAASSPAFARDGDRDDQFHIALTPSVEAIFRDLNGTKDEFLGNHVKLDLSGHPDEDQTWQGRLGIGNYEALGTSKLPEANDPVPSLSLEMGGQYRYHFKNTPVSIIGDLTLMDRQLEGTDFVQFRAGAGVEGKTRAGKSRVELLILPGGGYVTTSEPGQVGAKSALNLNVHQDLGRHASLDLKGEAGYLHTFSSTEGKPIKQDGGYILKAAALANFVLAHYGRDRKL
ncbi:MAG: hypothetical protein ACXVBW_12430, partial [Bdellovibrionota bacterium]